MLTYSKWYFPNPLAIKPQSRLYEVVRSIPSSTNRIKWRCFIREICWFVVMWYIEGNHIMSPLMFLVSVFAREIFILLPKKNGYASVHSNMALTLIFIFSAKIWFLNLFISFLQLLLPNVLCDFLYLLLFCTSQLFRFENLLKVNRFVLFYVYLRAPIIKNAFVGANNYYQPFLGKLNLI